jgi:hypothetical protein
MAGKNTSNRPQGELFNIEEQMRTAACVPAICEAVKAWREDGYPGVFESGRPANFSDLLAICL